MFNLYNSIIPKPRQIEDRNGIIKIGSLSKGAVSISPNGSGVVFDEALGYLNKKLCEKLCVLSLEGDYNISFSINSEDSRFDENAKKEAYIIDITETGAQLVGFDEAGAYYAAVSFAKLVHTIGSDVYIPKCFIYDYPYFSERGHFMECRYGSDFMTLDDWKKGIDYLSEMKINNITVGLYGCWTRQYDGIFSEYQYIPFEKYPQLNTPRDIKYYSAKQKKYIYKKDVLPTMYEDDYFGEMIAYGKKKNVKVIPLFNSYGHNTLIPRVFPEISAKDENGNASGVGLCTNNEKTYEIMFGIYDEIIDRYLLPNGIDAFEIGFDEVWPVLGFDKNNLNEHRSPFCRCEKCKDKSNSELMVEYLIKLTKYLKKRGMKSVYVYFDMLFEARLLNEELVERFKKEDIYDVIVIDWWSYGKRENQFRNRREDVNNLFRSIAKPITGYFHYILPTHAHEDVYSVVEIAMEHGFEGVVGYSSFEYCYDYNYNMFAECVWNPDEALLEDSTLKRYAQTAFPENAAASLDALHITNEFMAGHHIAANYLENMDYYLNGYLRANQPYPQDYPANAFLRIQRKEEDIIPYLRNVITKSEYVYRFFEENTSSREGDIWKLSALTYKALSDEFLTIYNCASAYNEKRIDESAFMGELLRLIAQREKLIALCEDVRIEANTYIPIRNMSVIRQFMLDLLSYMKKEINEGRHPQVDIFNFSNYLSDISWFLR